MNRNRLCKLLLAAGTSVLVLTLPDTTLRAANHSPNAVGFLNCSIPTSPTANTYRLMHNPFNLAGNALDNVMPVLPDGSQVYAFRGGVFEIYTHLFGTWLSTTVINPGEGFYLELPAGAPNPTTLTFVGDVPQGALVVPVPAGYSIRSHYGWGMAESPLGGLTTSLGFVPANGDQVYFYNGLWTIYTYLGGWIGPEPTPNLCESFWIENNSGAAYTWLRTVNVNNLGDVPDLALPLSGPTMTLGGFAFSFPTVSGVFYQMQTKSAMNLPWVTIGTVIGTGTPFTYTDGGSLGQTTRIYRVIY